MHFVRSTLEGIVPSQNANGSTAATEANVSFLDVR